jgi:hypothetical protein
MMLMRIVMINPAIIGMAVLFTIARGDTPMSAEAKIITAAAGDIVLPNADPNALMAPRSTA